MTIKRIQKVMRNDYIAALIAHIDGTGNVLATQTINYKSLNGDQALANLKLLLCHISDDFSVFFQTYKPEFTGFELFEKFLDETVLATTKLEALVDRERNGLVVQKTGDILPLGRIGGNPEIYHLVCAAVLSRAAGMIVNQKEGETACDMVVPAPPEAEIFLERLETLLKDIALEDFEWALLGSARLVFALHRALVEAVTQ